MAYRPPSHLLNIHIPSEKAVSFVDLLFMQLDGQQIEHRVKRKGKISICGTTCRIIEIAGFERAIVCNQCGMEIFVPYWVGSPGALVWFLTHRENQQWEEPCLN